MYPEILTHFSDEEKRLYDKVKPLLFERGYEIRFCQFTDQKNEYIRIDIENTTQHPITHRNCAEVSEILENILSLNIQIEVGSSGIDPYLTRLKDFETNLNETVQILLSEKINNKSKYIGTLDVIRNNGVELGSSLYKKLFIPFNLIRRSKRVIKEELYKGRI
ncbi:MAG: hypothetical protein H6845_02045 [Alphaproteobacteria bacterium]|nr:MAG: hypothetical protein H6845_02045 [Alphaproteobacteria bacterium]